MANYSGAFWKQFNLKELSQEERYQLRMKRERAVRELRELMAEPTIPNYAHLVRDHGLEAIGTHLLPIPRFERTLMEMVTLLVECPGNVREFEEEWVVDRRACYHNIWYDPDLIPKSDIDYWIEIAKRTESDPDRLTDRVERVVRHAENQRSHRSWPAYVNDSLRHYCTNTMHERWIRPEQA